jgi:Flp pilus assembly protein TadD
MTVGKEARMKMLRWKFPRLCGLTGALVTCGYVASPAWGQQNSGGFNSQPLVNAPQKPQSSSWLPKLPFSGSGKPAMKGPSSSTDDLPVHDTAKGKAKEPADLMSLARLNERRGQAELAKQMYLKELERNPKNGKAYHRLAVMSAKDEQWDEANEYFMKAEQLMPDNSELFADMGYALYLQHRLEPAENYLRRAVKLSPRNQSAYNNLGIVLGVQGKTDESFAAFKRVGTGAEAHTNMAYVHTQLGDVDEAMKHLTQALSLDPNLKVAAIALMQLNDIKKRYSPKDEPIQLADGKDAPKESAGPGTSVLASSASGSSPRQAGASAASDRIAEVSERPHPPARNELPAASPPSLAAELKSPLGTGEKPVPQAEPRPSAQFMPWLSDAARQSAAPSGAPLAADISKPTTSGPVNPVAPQHVVATPQATAAPPAAMASKPPETASKLAPIVERRPLPTVAALPPPQQTVAPARPVAELPLAAENKAVENKAVENKLVENKYVAVKAKPVGDASPAGKPPREVAARPLPGKNKDASAAATSASPATSFIHLPPTSEVAHAAAPSGADASRNISASAVATSTANPVAPALANVSVHKEKPLAPPPAEQLAPVVSPSERMQQLRARERADAADRKQSLKPVPSRAAGTSANGSAAHSSAKDASLLSLLPSTAAGMIPSAPQAANDSANPAMTLPTRQPSMTIPRAEDMMPADAMLYQAPTSSLHPAAQSMWSSSTQPLRYLTDQGGMSTARPGDPSADGSAGIASSRSGSLGGATAPNAATGQPSVPLMPRTY